MKHRFFIFTANHGRQEGIEDYIALLKDLLTSRGMDVELSPFLQAYGINLIIDEFTNCIENRRIAAFRKEHPNSLCIFVLTEFCKRKFGVESLNHFGGLFEAATITWFNLYLRLRRDDFPPARFRDWVFPVLYSPILLPYFSIKLTRFCGLRLIGKRVGNPMRNFIKKHHRLIYFHMRYLGLKAHLHFADAVITSHECIMPTFNKAWKMSREKVNFLGVIYPEFDEAEVTRQLMMNKQPFVEVTGSLTPYRRAWIRRLNHLITLLGIQNVFGLTRSLSFSRLNSSKYMERAAYSLHPPQSRTWPYCSPTRIYRALQVDHNMPILTKHFGQNPIEDICLVLNGPSSIAEMVELFFNRSALSHFVTPKIKKYNEIAKQRNDLVVGNLLGMPIELTVVPDDPSDA